MVPNIVELDLQGTVAYYDSISLEFLPLLSELRELTFSTGTYVCNLANIPNVQRLHGIAILFPEPTPSMSSLTYVDIMVEDFLQIEMLCKSASKLTSKK